MPIMPRCRHSVCAYWIISSMFVGAMFSRLLLDQRKITDQRNFKFVMAHHSNDTSHRCTQFDRLNQLSQHCADSEQNASEDRPKLSYDFLLVDDVHKVIYCAIPKAASTTWKAVMAGATGHPSAGNSMPEHQVEDATFLQSIGLRYLSSYSDAEATSRLAEYFKFTFVRHPLTRLISAYRDKVARYNPYGVRVRRRIATFSAGGRWNSSDDVDITPPRTNKFHRVTFQQFARYVINEATHGRFDHHWTPYEQLCHLCRIRYDFVGKVETMNSDSYRVVSRLYSSRNDGGPEVRQRVPTFNANRRRHRAAAATTDDDTITSSKRSTSGRFKNQLSELETLSPDESQQLIGIYANDMRMLGYGWRDGWRDEWPMEATCHNTLSVLHNRTCC